MQSSAGVIPAGHGGQIPANFWMVTNSGNSQGMGVGSDPVWTFPSVGNSGNLYRAGMSASSGLHFMNFPTAPVALFPGQQLGSGAGSANMAAAGEGHLGMLAAAGFNPYRHGSGTGIPESPGSGSRDASDGHQQ